MSTNNIIGYEICFEIETGLREFIIDQMNKSYPEFDWTNEENNPIGKLGSDKRLIEHIDAMRAFSIKRGFTPEQAQELHSVYFLLLTDLKTIIEKNYKKENNRIDVFGLNTDKKSAITSGIQSIFLIRNKIAHMVKVTEEEIDVLRQALNSFKQFIPNFNEYIDQSEKRMQARSTMTEAKNILITNLLNGDELETETLALYDQRNLISFTEDELRLLAVFKEYQSKKGKVGSSIQIKNLIQDNKELLQKHH